MKWRKHGIVWGPRGDMPWAAAYATCPTPILRSNGVLRVFVQCRDARNVGRVGWVDLDPSNPCRAVGWASRPALDIGQPGCFDDNGVFPTSVVRMADGRLFLYFVGFELSHHIRYRLLTGLAVSEDDGDSFRRVTLTPILERSTAELYFRCGPFVLHDGGRFRMWYVGGGEWDTIDGKPMPVYDMRYMESADGVSWPDHGCVVLPLNREREHGFGRPFVVRDDGGYRMHYSIRNRRPATYRLGYAQSTDGVSWNRLDDELGLEINQGAFDGDMMCFGAEITVAGRTWLLYNGDDFGVAGFAAAERIDG